MKRLTFTTALAFAVMAPPTLADNPDYFDAARGLAMERDDAGVRLVTINDGAGGPITFTAQDHTEFTEAFHRIGQDRENQVVILTGARDWMAEIDFATFGDVPDPDVWMKVHAGP